MAIGRTEAVVPEIHTLFSVGTLSGMTDGQLLERFAGRRDGGGEAAFGALVARHGPMVLGVCRQLLGDPHDADDAFQATFLVLARRAGSIRNPDLLANWLYGVALRTAGKSKAQRARRRKRQEQEAAMSSAEPAWNHLEPYREPLLREQSEAIHEEVGRLSAKYRAPIVLCYLEGVSQDETARRLRCPIGTVRSRLARARDQLRGRLLRRGIALPAIAITAALSPRGASAAVPNTLAEMTIRAAGRFAAGQATTGLASATAAALSERVLRTMFLTKLKIGAAVLLTVGAMSWLAIGFAQSALGEGAGPLAASSATAPVKADSNIEVRGKVLDLSSGQPIAGAGVELSTDPVPNGSTDRLSRAKTEDDGRFRFIFSTKGMPKAPKLIARAKGFALDWVDLDLKKPGELTLRLPKDDVPIDGRIVDLEGRPVAGVKIELGTIFKSDDGQLGTYFDQVKSKDLYYGNADFDLLKHATATELNLPASQTTDADGRLHLSGIGRNRVVHLVIRGKTIEHDYQRVVTQTEPKDLPKTFHVARFVHNSAPSKPIVGTVRIKGTDKPAKGVWISMDGHQKVVTDDQGHYQLDGIAKRKQYALWAQGDRYFTLLKMDIADTPGLDPLTVDFEVGAGIAIKGRVVHKDTGLPVNANIEYVPYSHNPNLKQYAPSAGIYQGAKTKGDGSFAIVGIPGPGLLCVRTEGGQYLKTDTTLIDALPKTDYGFPETAPPANPGEFNAMVPVDTPEDESKGPIHEITVRSGHTLEVELVDSEGKPVKGAHVGGREAKRQAMGPIPGKDSRKIADSKFTAVGLDSSHGRYLVIVEPVRKLGKLQPIRGDEPAPLKVTLEPLGAFKGRLVNSKGLPLGGLEVKAMAPRELSRYWKDDPALPEEVMFGYDRPDTLPERFGGKATTAADGTFKIEGLIPGFPYVVQIFEPGQRNFFDEQFFKGTSMSPATIKDLGDLKVRGR